jgi:hypothetical protein
VPRRSSPDGVAGRAEIDGLANSEARDVPNPPPGWNARWRRSGTPPMVDSISRETKESAMAKRKRKKTAAKAKKGKKKVVAKTAAKTKNVKAGAKKSTKTKSTKTKAKTAAVKKRKLAAKPAAPKPAARVAKVTPAAPKPAAPPHKSIVERIEGAAAAVVDVFTSAERLHQRLDPGISREPE